MWYECVYCVCLVCLVCVQFGCGWCGVCVLCWMCLVCVIFEWCVRDVVSHVSCCSLLCEQERPSNSRLGALLLPKAVFYPLSPREEGSSIRTRRNGPWNTSKVGNGLLAVVREGSSCSRPA